MMRRRKSRLKACPFCGGRPIVRAVETLEKGKTMPKKRYAVVCTHRSCVIYRKYGQVYGTLKRAIKHWNRRAGEKKGFWKWAN